MVLDAVPLSDTELPSVRELLPDAAVELVSELRLERVELSSVSGPEELVFP